MMKMSRSWLVALLFACVASMSLRQNFVLCADPDPVLDFCVADVSNMTEVWQTGTEKPTWMDTTSFGVASSALNDTTDSNFPCKSPVTVIDFVFKGLGLPQKVTSKLGSKVTPAFVTQFPALNTLGISAARIDFVKGGLNQPHVHPRATELLRVIQGSLLVGFVDTTNTLFLKTLQTGDLFVFPKGTLHFQMEVGQGNAVAFANLNSQNPGTLMIAPALFAATPQPIDAAVLEKALGIEGYVLDLIQAGVKKIAAT